MGRITAFYGCSAALALLLTGCGAPQGLPGRQEADSGVLASHQVAHREKDFGVPTFVWLEPGARPAPGSQATDVAWQVLKQLAPVYRLSAAALAATSVRGVHDTGQGGVIVHFEQRVASSDVFRLELSIALRRNLEPVAASGFLAPLVRPTAAGFALDEQAAIAAAAQAMLGSSQSLPLHAMVRTGGENGHSLYALPTLLSQGDTYHPASPARVRRTWYPRPEGLLPAYFVMLDLSRGHRADSEMQAFVISARDGSVLFQKNLTAADSYSYRVWADKDKGFTPWDGPEGTAFSPNQTGKRDGTVLTFVPSQLVTLQNAPFSRNDPWLPPGATEARGNNAIAYADIADPDGLSTGDLMLTTSSPGNFDYSLDPAAQDPASTPTTIKAVNTNFFYIVNFLHDYFYDSGWNEQSRNPQSDNFGRGGIGGDPVRAESQDASGRNNANASTPPDGTSPRIQMYLWDRTRSLHINTPPAIAGEYENGSAEFGPGTFNVTGDAVIVDDGVAPKTNGCEAPFVNAAAVAGHIAIIDRGSCNLEDKVYNAQLSGAIGVVVVNNRAGAPSFMPEGDPLPPAPVTIPSLMIGQGDGQAIEAALTGGTAVNITLLSASRNNDSSLDGTIASHEWGHVLSNRLIGNASGLDNTQGNGMGEGWSDFVALLTIVRPEDASSPANVNWNGLFPVSLYSAGPGNNAAFDGIRRYPYSADLTRDPLTFQYIQEGLPLPASPPPLFGSDGVGNSEQHNVGEIWASMLWDCYVSLLRDTSRYTFAQANRTMRDYLVASLKMTPNSPTILEARDAMLAAAYANSPQDFQLFAQAFARRGAGIGALGPDRASTDNIPVTESFAVGSSFQVVSIAVDDAVNACVHDGVLSNGESGHLTVKLRNTGTVPLVATANVTVDSPTVTLGSGGKLTFPTVQPFATTTATLDVAMQGAATNQAFAITVAVDAMDQAVPGTVTDSRTFHGNYDVIPGTSGNDTMDDSNPVWNVAYDANLDSSQPWHHDDQNGWWSLPDTGAPSDHYLISPPLQVASMGSFGFTLQHRYSWEADSSNNYDGSVIELSSDDGKTWNDIESALTMNGYGGQIWKENAVLTLRNGFVGDSPGYPDFSTTVADFGTAYQGQTVRLRFRGGTDPASGFVGWDLDSITFTGITNTPFSSRGLAHTSCDNRAPLASAGTAQQVTSGAQVTLQGGASDPDGDALTSRWTQTGGPMVMLSDAGSLTPTFTAPQVNASTPLTFSLVANDGHLDSFPASVTITVVPQTTAEMMPPTVPPPATPQSGCTAVPASASSTASLLVMLFALLVATRRRLGLALGLFVVATLGGCGGDSPAPTQFGLFANRSGSGSGRITSQPAGLDCGVVCSVLFNSGTQVVLSAAPDASSQFSGWKGDCSGTAPTCTVVLDMSRTVEAVFDGGPSTVTVTKSGDGGGLVKSDPPGLDCGASCQATFPAETMVTLTATADAQSTFLGWSGECQSMGQTSGRTCVVRATASREVTAAFAQRICSADGICWERPFPQGNDLNAVQVVSASDIWAAGARGTILHFDGKRWSQSASGITADLRGLWATAPADIWAVGDGGAILHWNGSAWSASNSGVKTNLRGIWAASATSIWAVGDGGVALQGNGTTWTPSTTGAASDESLRSVHGSAADNVWAVSSQGQAFQWSGTSWSMTTISDRRLLGVWVGAADNVWAVGDFGEARQWNGTKWSDRSVNFTLASLVAVFSPAANDLWAMTSEKQLLRWDGMSWSPLDSPSGAALTSVHGTASELWMVGSRGAIARWNGSTLSAVSTQSEVRGFGAVWGSAGSVWFVGATGLVGHFDGTALSQSESGVDADLLAVHGSADDNVWAAGTGGAVVRYDGKAWQRIETGTPRVLHGVWTAGAKDSWVVGELGTVLHYDGSKWSSLGSTAADDLYAVWGMSSQDLWVAGATELLHYDGTSWNKETSVTGPLYTLGGRSSDDVWTAGGGGLLYRRSSGTWQPVSAGTSQTLRSIAFSSPTEMWLVGEGGLVLRGSATQLTQLQSGTGAHLYGVWASSTQEVWMVGSPGVLSYRR